MSLNSRKLVFLDIDGTLLPKSHHVTEKVKQALRRAYENGHFLCICTGRAYSELPEGMEKFDGVISAAGACIMWKGEILLAEYFSKEEIGQVVDLLEEVEAVYVMEGLEKTYSQKENYKRFWEKLDSSDQEEELLRSILKRTYPCTLTAEMEKTHKCSFFYAKKESAWLRERLKKWDMSLTAFSQAETRGSSGEITKTAFSKGTAVRYLSEFLGIPIEDTIAIGDSENDLEMLKAVGVGIAMGNAPDYVKEAADDVTKSVEEDGVYYAFLKYGLLDE